MAQYGLGNFVYEFVAANGVANFKFHDPEDVSNTAETSVAPKEFPEGIKDADSRQVADVAWTKVQEGMNRKRDARIKKDKADEFNKAQDEDARAREAASDFIKNSEDTSVATAKENEDGTKVYNTKTARDAKESK